MRAAKWLLVALVCTGLVRAEEPQAAPARDVWESAQIGPARAGFFRTTTEELTRDGKKVFRTAQELSLTVKRDRALVRLRMISGTEETEDGKVVGVFMRQFHDKGELVSNGTVKDGKLHVEVDKGRFTREVPWNDKVIGLRAQDTLFQRNKAKAGDKFTYQSFEPTLNTVLTTHATVGVEEEVDVLGMKKKLLKATLTTDKVPFQGGEIQLPAATVWLDKDLLPVRREVEIPGLGKIVTARTTRDIALANAEPAQLADILLQSLIRLNKKIVNPYSTASAVYKITIDDEKPETALARDDRQQVKLLTGKTVEVQVRAIRAPVKKELPGELKDREEFLSSCYFINSDDETVKDLAKKAVGDEADPWKRSQQIARWVKANMKTDNTVPFGPAGEVARGLRGDCRQHALLGTAMCRAAGVPARTAIGLVYVDDPMGRPVLGFHMWMEVWVQGQWVALDPIMGAVGATHIKVTDHSWHKVESLTPLLPVTRVLGKMKVEVDKVEYP